MRARRWRLGIVVGLCVVVGILIAGHSSLLRWAVIARVQAATGRTATIEALSFDLFTGHVGARGLRVADHDGSELAFFEHIDARPHLPSLLRGHVRLDHLDVVNSTIRVVRFSNSEFNLSDIIRRGERKRAGPLDVSVDRFTVRGGTVTLEDRLLSPWRTWRSEDLTVDARNISTTHGGGSGVATSRLEGAPVSVSVHDRARPRSMGALRQPGGARDRNGRG